MNSAERFMKEYIAVMPFYDKNSIEVYNKKIERLLTKHGGKEETRPPESDVAKLVGYEYRYVFSDGSKTEWF